MLRLLRFLITGSWHEHKWKIIKEGVWVCADNHTKGTYYNLQCEICGNVKNKNT